MKKFLSFIISTFVGSFASAQCGGGQAPVTLEITTDAYGYEFYWEIVPQGNSCGFGTVASGGNTSVSCNGGGQLGVTGPGSYANTSVTSDGPYCLTDGAAYDLIMIDDWGDGGTSVVLQIPGQPSASATGATTVLSFTPTVPAADDAELISINLQPLMPAGMITLTGTIQNNGSNAITDFDIFWNDGVSGPQSENFTSLSIPASGTYNFSHGVPIDMTSPGSYTVSAYVELPGSVDADNSNDTLTVTTTVIDNPPTRYHVVEEANGTWCGWCPRGTQAMNQLGNFNNVIRVAVHNGDPMTDATYDAGMGGQIAGYPSGLINRASGAVDPSTFVPTIVGGTLEELTPVGVQTNVIGWNSSTRVATIDVGATFYASLTGDYRINLVVTEDNIQETAAGYNQANYYSGSTSLLDTTIGGSQIDWQNLANPVTAADMNTNFGGYQHVGRSIEGGWDGVVSSIPASVSSGVTYTYQFNVTVDPAWDENELNFVGWVTDFSTGEILNAHEVVLADSSQGASLTVSISSNDESSCGSSDGDALASVSGGTTPYSYLWSDSQVSAAAVGLSAGVYILTVTDNSASTVTQSVTISCAGGALSGALSSTNGLCGSSNGSISSSITGGSTPYSYLWSNGATTTSLTGLENGSFTLTVTDGQAAQITLTNTITCTTVTIGNSSRHVLVEASGGTWNGWEPRGYVYLDSLKSLFGNNVSVISVHNSDTMDNTVYSSGVGFSGMPAANIDRYHNDKPTPNWISDVQDRIATGAVVDVNLSLGWNNSTRDLNVNITSDFTSSISGGDYRYNAAIVENNIVGSGSSFNQANFYAGGGAGQMGGYEIMPNPIPAAQMEYDHVAREILGGYDGVTGNLPTSITQGASYNHTFNYNVPTNYNASNIVVVAWISDNNTGEVLNSWETALNPSSSGNIVLSMSSTNDNCASSIGTASVSAIGGTAPYTYSWSNGGNTSTVSGLGSGTYTVVVTDNNGDQQAGSVAVNQAYSNITLSPSITNTTCGQATGAISIAVSGGLAPYTYAWTNGDTTASISGLVANPYMVYVTDNSGCTYSQAFNINDGNGPVLTTNNVNNVSCSGGNDGAIDVTISGGTLPYQVVWSTGVFTEDLSNLTSGLYDLNVTDASGCVLSGSYSITEPTPLDVNFYTFSASCGNADGAASVVKSGGTPPYTGIWSTGSNQSSVTGLAAGVYSYAVFDNNGCAYTEITQVNEVGAPVLTIDSVTHVNCGLSNGAVYVSAIGGSSPYTYDWSNGGTSNSINGLDEDTYTVTVTGNNGCSSFIGQVVGKANTFSDPICLVSVDSLTGTNLIAWEKPSVGYIDHYNVFRESSQAGVFVKINEVPYDSLGIYIDTIANPMVRSWRYKLSYTDTCGEESERSIAHKTVHVTQNIGPNQSMNLLWDHYQGFTFNTYRIYRYTDTEGTELLDSVPSNLTSYTDFLPPIANEIFYIIEVVHPDGCNPTLLKASNYSSSRSNRPNSVPSPADGTNLPPAADFMASSITIAVGESVDFTDLSTNNPTGWIWLFDGGSPSSSISQNPLGVQYNTPGVYDVTLITSNGNGTDTLSRTGYVAVGGTGIENMLNNLSVEVFPNPTTGSVQVSVNGLVGNGEIVIQNTIGQTIESRFVRENSSSFVETVDFTPYGAGIYQLSLKTDYGVLNRKIVVK